MKPPQNTEVGKVAAPTLPSSPVPVQYRGLAQLLRGKEQVQRKNRLQKGLQPSAVAAPPMEKLAKPDAQGRFGKFGGKYVPETLMAALTELEDEFYKALDDQSFQVSI